MPLLNSGLLGNDHWTGRQLAKGRQYRTAKHSPVEGQRNIGWTNNTATGVNMSRMSASTYTTLEAIIPDLQDSMSMEGQL